MASGDLIGLTAQRNSGRGPHERRALGEVILSRRNRGETIYAISQAMELSEQTVYRYMKLALAARLAPTVDEYRRQQNDRLDQTQREIEANLLAANTLGQQGMKDGNPSLIERAIAQRSTQIGLQLRLDERRAKLNGLDAPIKVDATITPVDPFDAEMAEMIRKVKADQAVKEEAQTDV